MALHDGSREWKWAVTGLGGIVQLMEALAAAGAVADGDTATELETALRKLEPIKNRLLQQSRPVDDEPADNEKER